MKKYYFPHEFNSQNDRKLKLILHKFGLAGIGLYWCIAERLYCENGYLPISDISLIASELGTTSEFVNELLDLKINNNEKLFDRDEDCFWNNTVLEKIEIINKKTQIARENAQKRWNQQKQPQSDSNAVADSKVSKLKTTKPIKEYLKLDGLSFINLTQKEYETLIKKYGQDRTITAIKIFDNWLEKKGKTASQYIGKPHYAHFKSDGWIWERADAQLRTQLRGNTNYGI